MYKSVGYTKLWCGMYEGNECRWVQWCSGRVSDSQVVGSTHTRSTASNLEQVANLLCAQANSASYLQWDGK